MSAADLLFIAFIVLLFGAAAAVVIDWIVRKKPWNWKIHPFGIVKSTIDDVDKKRKRGEVSAWEGFCIIAIGVALQIFVYWMAFELAFMGVKAFKN